MRKASRFSALACVALTLALLWHREMAPRDEGQIAGAPVMRLGYTFSSRQADYLGVPRQTSFDAAIALDTSVVRLGAYWDEIERKQGEFDFTDLDWQMDRAANHGRPVVLTVGMKAPRWPEFFLPDWLEERVATHTSRAISDDPEVRERTLRFVREVVSRYREHPALHWWQVENEPLDPSGPRGWYLRAEFLAQEVAAVRALDTRQRPIVLNMFAHLYPMASVLPWSRGDDERAATLLEHGDILGLDVYPSVSLRLLRLDLYFNFTNLNWPSTLGKLASLAHQAGKQAWIVEAQAEPWEPSRVVATGPGPAPSMGPAQAESIFQKLRTYGFDTILLWGVEHWYMRREVEQDSSWWNSGQQIFKSGLESHAEPGATLRVVTETSDSRS